MPNQPSYTCLPFILFMFIVFILFILLLIIHKTPPLVFINAFIVPQTSYNHVHLHSSSKLQTYIFYSFHPTCFLLHSFLSCSCLCFLQLSKPPLSNSHFCLLYIHLKLLQANCNAPFCLHLSPCLLPNLFMIFCSPPKVHTHVTKRVSL